MGRHIGDKGLFAGGRPRKESNEARYKVPWGTKRVLHCNICGALIIRYSSVILHSNHGKKPHGIYCSKKCFGKWLGKHFGRYALKASQQGKKMANKVYNKLTGILESFVFVPKDFIPPPKLSPEEDRLEKRKHKWLPYWGYEWSPDEIWAMKQDRFCGFDLDNGEPCFSSN